MTYNLTAMGHEAVTDRMAEPSQEQKFANDSFVAMNYIGADFRFVLIPAIMIAWKRSFRSLGGKRYKGRPTKHSWRGNGGQKMPKKIFITMAIALMASGCSTDNRQRIAMETLYPEHSPALAISGKVLNDTMYIPAPVLAGALNEKFPAGTDLEELKKYVARFDGKCDQNQPEQIMECRFVETGTFCAETEVIITAKTTPLRKIGHITAYREHKTC